MRPSSDPESSALETVLSQFAGLVRSVALRHGFSIAELDEIFQEVRIRLWKSRGDSERVAASPASYVYKTAVSAALDLGRRNHGRPGPEFDDALLESLASPRATTPDVDAQRAELADKLHAALQAVTESRRAVVRMYLNGYRQAEIEELFDWTEAKTRNLLYRGLAELREQLAARGIGPDAAT